MLPRRANNAKPSSDACTREDEKMPWKIKNSAINQSWRTPIIVRNPIIEKVARYGYFPARPPILLIIACPVFVISRPAIMNRIALANPFAA